MKIEFLNEKVVYIGRGQTILEASLRGGIPHFHACGGVAKCSTCRIRIVDGGENLSPVNEKEGKLRMCTVLPEGMRLACQTSIMQGSATVDRTIKDESDIRPKFGKAFSDKITAYKPLGEERQLVLFFLDIRDFTPFVERNLAYDVIHLLRKLFGIFYKIIKRYKGQIIETSGDQLYAVFGFRSSIEEASDAAIQAGQAIIAALEIYNTTAEGLSFANEFKVGIGAHAGKVIAGSIQIGRSRKVSVMGLAVNIASRIQGCTRELNNSFVVSESMLGHSSFQETRPSEVIVLRGITGVCKVYLLGKPYR